MNPLNLHGFDLPDGWAVEKLSSFVDVIMGQSPPSETYNIDGDGLAFFQGKAEFGVVYPTIEKYCSEPNKVASQGDILLSIRAPVGPTNIASVDCCIGRGLAALHPLGNIGSKFILYLFRALEPQISKEGTGSTFKAINKQFVENLTVALPPFNEQNRIVAKIEELFSELDKGIEYLKTSREQLKVHRQSVLKYAFEGKLTQQWRDAHAGQLETAVQLLEHIRQERQWQYQQQAEEWEQAVKNWEDSGKEGRKPSKPQLPKSINLLTEQELAELPHLPEGWCWARVEELGDVQLGRQRSPQNRSRDFPTKYVRAANITEDGFDLTDVMDMEFKPHEFERYQLKYGDILLSEASGSLDQVGKPALWRDQISNCCFQNTVIRFQAIYLSSEYFLNVFRHFYFNGIFSRIASGVGINHLSANKFAALPVPLATLEEQRQIVQEVELQLSICKQLETIATENLQKAEVLRQSLLKKAFSGQLMPQDINDESAKFLLERIKSSRESQKIEGSVVSSPRKQSSMNNNLSIIEVLKELKGVAIAKKVWQNSKYRGDIEGFYAELNKEIKDERIEEFKNGRESYLSLKNEN